VTDLNEGDTHTYKWDLGDGSAPVEGTLTPAHTYAEDGVYTVTLTVTDSDGLDISNTLTVTVRNLPPEVEAGSDVTAPANQAITFNGSFNDPGAQDTHTIHWDFGDGTTASGTLTSSHTYAAFGTYIVTLIVTDDDGGVSTDTLTVNVQFAFSGFFSPVDNPPTVNVVNAGRAIPIKFSLGGDQGLHIFAPGYPASSAVACGATAEDAIEETVTAGNSSLSYKTDTDRYTYVWKTDAAWGGTCRVLVLKLIDGTYHRLYFRFE
jgi:PKD repeat protein